MTIEIKRVSYGWTVYVDGELVSNPVGEKWNDDVYHLLTVYDPARKRYIGLGPVPFIGKERGGSIGGIKIGMVGRKRTRMVRGVEFEGS